MQLKEQQGFVMWLILRAEGLLWRGGCANDSVNNFVNCYFSVRFSDIHIRDLKLKKKWTGSSF